MPNWCQNYVTLTHEDPAMIEKALGAFRKGDFFKELVPRPEEEEENWYSWNINNWGTKWDVGDEDGVGDDMDENMLSLHFDSAWSPPLAGYEKLEELGFTVEGYYCEEGIGFCGLYACGLDDCYDIEGDSKWVVENIPKEIDEMFAISENMDMWEQDQAEEELRNKSTNEEQ
jgi:hypothetical protein